MSSPSLQEFRENVRSHTDIVSLIGESIALQPRHGGRQYVGLCPFHDDKNPSLNVYPDRQTFRCWSCNTGGDAFTFLMEREHVTFPEAMEILARRANLEIPKRITGYSPQQENDRARQFEVLQWAEEQFHRALLDLTVAEPVRRYLAERNVSQEMIERFRLGYHPDDWYWLCQKANGRFPISLLQEVKLVGESNNRPRDFFVNRLMFPIRNERGQAVSFGGRVLPGSKDDRKYWNGPESPVFHKSRVLYALDQARDGIKKHEMTLVVEGYTACIACHQFGFPNAVATLGTALTDLHVANLKRFSQRVVLVYDGDEAGRRAASRAVERFLAQNIDLRVLTLPENLDPADYLNEYGPENFAKLIESAPEAWDYQYQVFRKQYGLNSIDGRQRILDGMLQLLAQSSDTPGSLREGLLIANLAQRLTIPEEFVQRELKNIRQQVESLPKAENPTEKPRISRPEIERILKGRLSRDDRLECDLLEILFASPELIGWMESDGVGAIIRNVVFRDILNACLEEARQSGQFTLSRLMDQVDDSAMKTLLVWIDEQAVSKGLPERLQRLKDNERDENGCPLLLRQSLENLHWRQSEETQSDVAVQLIQDHNANGNLDKTTEELLLQAAEFHKQRATKKSRT